MAEFNNDNQIKKGGISVETEHIFPIIKKWLYSEKDIFLREIVSNASDAITKLKRLASLGHTELSEEDIEGFRIDVTVDKDAGTLTVEDNGIGMTEDELEKYICQIALSGALDFINKYEGESKDGDGGAASGIIGHFGLGFYSSFMVSDRVEIFTKSYTDAPAVHWTCTEAGEYEINPCDKETRGTKVVMHIADDEKEYLEGFKIRGVLNKYCAFMPVDIYLHVEGEGENEHDEGCECEECHDKHEHEHKEQPINDKYPLWQRPASECTPEMYNEFYHKVFGDFRDPLFYIHINADYPLNFKGILFFPKYNNEYESLEGQVKLFYNQVFVADNIKEVIPEYLLMLKGVLDCPELPLNVSRSYLQNNTYVQKVGAHIVKKVADKLASMCNTDREAYEKVWDDIHIFVEFACIRDQKFYDRVKPALLLRLTDKKFATLDEYLEHAKEKHENTVYYATDVTLQAQYISMFESLGVEVAVFDKPFETQYISTLERYNQNVKFVRIDSDIADILKADEQAVTDEAMQEKLTALFRKVSANEKLTVKLNSLKANKVPAILTVSEDSRRMDEFMKMYARAGINPGADSYPLEYTLSLNTSAPIIGNLEALLDTDTERAELIAGYIYKLTLLANRKLTPEEMQAFMSESFDILEKL